MKCSNAAHLLIFVRKLTQISGNGGAIMTRYRFVTPNRAGKWYADLDTAKRFACQIGAGFMDTRTGRFIAYAGTKLETSAGTEAVLA
jgi:hypothetical protein